MKTFFDSLLNVSAPDPDDARRRRVLNILLLSTLVATIVGFVAIVAGSLTSKEFTKPETQLLLGGTLITTLGLG